MTCVVLIGQLKSLPATQRSVEASMLLGRLLQRVGSNAEALLCFKDVLRYTALSLSLCLSVALPPSVSLAL